CQTCRTPMTLLPTKLDVSPSDWHPSDDRIAAVLTEVFHCVLCGRVAIRPPVSESPRSQAA
ncbi:MAG TPA: hypothetical protein VGL03_04900, partial [Thermoanaerobaculia bacterium]